MNKLSTTAVIFGFFLSMSFAISAQTSDWLQPFSGFYQQELGHVSACGTQKLTFKVCSDALKNEGNAPFILHHEQPTDTTIVLFHGLSDSPFFFTQIAPTLHDMGYTVIVALLPGHGKMDADDDMEDATLAIRWQHHVREVTEFAQSLSSHVYIGGFSTGGALATQYILTEQTSVDGLLLFSGALALDQSVEDMYDIWGIGTMAKLLDWEYETQGPNPYKYPGVSNYSAIKLLDVIFDVRQKLADGAAFDLPIFAAHSEADVTTPIRGVKDLIQANGGNTQRFFIPLEKDVCHADLVVNQTQIAQMQFDETMLEEITPCSVPKANPAHEEMLQALVQFMGTSQK